MRFDPEKLHQILKFLITSTESRSVCTNFVQSKISWSAPNYHSRLTINHNSAITEIWEHSKLKKPVIRWQGMPTCFLPWDRSVRIEAQKAAFDNGFRVEHGSESGWLCYGSTTAEGKIWIAGCSDTGPWLLSVEHAGVQAEIGLRSVVEMPGPGNARFAFDNLRDLYTALDRVYRLAMSLPDVPLRQSSINRSLSVRFYLEIAGLTRETEIQRLVVQRIGQTLFRQALLRYWNGQCPLTGITEEPLLRASHIIPWSECDTDKLRLDVHNGLLLSAL